MDFSIAILLRYFLNSNQIKIISLSAFLFVALLVTSCDPKETVIDQKQMSIADNEDFKWLSLKIPQLSKNIADHHSSLSEQQLEKVSNLLKGNDLKARNELLRVAMGFENSKSFDECRSI